MMQFLGAYYSRPKYVRFYVSWSAVLVCERTAIPARKVRALQIRVSKKVETAPSEHIEAIV